MKVALIAIFLFLLTASSGYAHHAPGHCRPGKPQDCPPAPSPPSSKFGVAAGWNLSISDSDLSQELDGVAQIGGGWWRIDFDWSVIEPSPGVYRWELLDRQVAAASQRGIKVFAMIGYTPPWANGGLGNKHPPNNPQDFANFAGLVASRYALQGIHHYEIWNEPNLGCCFWQPYVNAGAYATLLSVAYSAIKASDPSAVVIGGATAPAGAYNDANCDGIPGDKITSNGNENPVNYIEDVNAAGGTYDAWSHHPYDQGGFDGPCSGWAQLLDIANRTGGKKIWATEYGNCTCWMSEQQQADFLRSAFDRWKNWQPGASLFYFNYRSSDFGLVRSDFTPRPAWFAYRDYPK